MRPSLFLLLPLFLGCEESTVASRPAGCVAGAEGPYKVEYVSDADTISVRIPGRKPVVVRLIGVDSPEVEGPYRRAEPDGVEARQFARSLLGDHYVYLESDPEQGRQDKYGRRLSYVHRAGDCLFVNAEVIRQGHGESYRRFRFRHRELFARYEREARAKRLGMWRH